MAPLQFPLEFDNPTYGLLGVVLASAAITLFALSFRRLRFAQRKLELVQWKKLRILVRILNIGTKAGVVISLSFLLAMPYFPTTIQVPIAQATQEQMAQYKVAAVLLMDVSYSMNNSDLRPTRLEVSKALAKAFVNQIDPDDLVGLVTFAGQVYDVVFPTANRTKVTERIDNQTLHPYTAIGNALETAIGMLETVQEGKAIVLFSDGKSNLGANITLAVNEAVIQKIPVFTVSFGTYGLESDPIALREMSSRTGGEYYEVRNENVEGLVTSVSEISQQVKFAALSSVYDEITVFVKDYQTANVFFSSVLVASLFLMWFTGV